jgi:hypothetical protein
MASVTKEDKATVVVSPPRFQTAVFNITGEHLVIHRFSQKAKDSLKGAAEEGQAARSKKKRSAKNSDAEFNAARYVSPEGWDGFHAASIRNAMISACRLVGFKMVLAKLSVFVVADGYDAAEPQIPLIRIYGEPTKQEDVARVATGAPYVCVRPGYHHWSARPKIRWDADQFSLSDVTNLLMRVGEQVGIGEGRPDSKESAGIPGWGLFTLENK